MSRERNGHEDGITVIPFPRMALWGNALLMNFSSSFAVLVTAGSKGGSLEPFFVADLSDNRSKLFSLWENLNHDVIIKLVDCVRRIDFVPVASFGTRREVA